MNAQTYLKHYEMFSASETQKLNSVEPLKNVCLFQDKKMNVKIVAFVLKQTTILVAKSLVIFCKTLRVSTDFYFWVSEAENIS